MKPDSAERPAGDTAAGQEISVIVPTLDEAPRIGALIGDLRGRSSAEIVVADGESGDGTAAIAREAGAKVVVSRRGRANQMNAGAGAAGGEVFLFLHADTRLPEDFETAILTAFDEREVVGGAFRFRLDGRERSFRFLEKTTNFRSGRLGVIFGDQAIFCRSEAFLRVGGFPNQPLLEDYEFVRRLRRFGRVTLLPEAVMTSSRRWKSVGTLRNSLLNVAVTWAYILGVSPERLKSWHRRWSGEKTAASN